MYLSSYWSRLERLAKQLKPTADLDWDNLSCSFEKMVPGGLFYRFRMGLLIRGRMVPMIDPVEHLIASAELYVFSVSNPAASRVLDR